MKVEILVNNALYFANEAKTCYASGGWTQLLTEAEKNRLCTMYQRNQSKRDTLIVGTRACDCICFIKGLLAGASETVFPPYSAIAGCSVGDCTVAAFGDKLLDRIENPGSNVPYGYALVRNGEHAALSLGDGRYIDASYEIQNGKCIQNGVKIKELKPGMFTRAGKIPGVEYGETSSTSAGTKSERETLEAFCKWAIDEFLATR